MDAQIKQNEIIKIKRGAFYSELIPVAVIITVLYFLSKYGYIYFHELSCLTPLLDTGTKDIGFDSWSEVVNQNCVINFIVKSGSYTLFPYFLLCILLILSPLQASPTMYFRGIFVTNEKGNKPSLHEVIKLVVFGIHLIPLYFVCFYALYRDFTFSLHQITNIIFTYAGLTSSLLLFEVFYKSDHVWDERVSGLRYNFTQKKIEKIEKEIEKLNTWYNRPFIKLQRINIGPILGFLIFGFLAINVLREGLPPEDYNEVLYKRAPPVWEDNAYFALAGLDAPEHVKDFYAYGKQEIIFHSGQFIKYKNDVGLPYSHSIPETDSSLFHSEQSNEKLKFDDRDMYPWKCLYDFQSKMNTSSCPDKGLVLNLIKTNKELWRRFQTLPDYDVFSIPDHFLEVVFKGQDLIQLSQLNAVYILGIQAREGKDTAVLEWIRYMKLYLNMASTNTSLVNKAIYLILVLEHKNLLEMLLYNDPTIAITYGDEIKDLLTIENINFFQNGGLIADDWRILEPWALPVLGSSANQKKLLYSCFKEVQGIANLSAFQFFKIKSLSFCSNEYPKNVDEFILKSFTDSGNFITNIIYNLLMGGVIKGESLIRITHLLLVDFKMSKVAIELIKNNVRAERVESYLQNMPKEYKSPITNSPFAWDQKKKTLYYEEPNKADLVPIRRFHLNIE